MTQRSERGKRAEALACAALRREGLQVEATNVRFPVGEIDIVAREGPALCFVEVRSKSSTTFGNPLESVTMAKRRRLLRAAQWYLKRHRALPAEIRFDVVAIEWHDHAPPTLELVRGAFTADV